MTREDEGLNLKHLREPTDRLCGVREKVWGSGAQERGQGSRPQPETAFGMRGKWPQGVSGLARRKHENPQGEGWAGDGAQERAKEGLVREGRGVPGLKCPGNGSQPGLRVARRGGGRSRLRLGQVWATLPRVAGKGCMLGWQLEEEAELESFRGGPKPCGREEVPGTRNGEEGTDLRLRGSSSAS